MDDLVNDLRQKVSVIREGGGQKAKEKKIQRGSLLARDRVDKLLDPGFLLNFPCLFLIFFFFEVLPFLNYLNLQVIIYIMNLFHVEELLLELEEFKGIYQVLRIQSITIFFSL